MEYFFLGQIKTHTSTRNESQELLRVVSLFFVAYHFFRLTATPSATVILNHALETPAFSNDLVRN